MIVIPYLNMEVSSLLLFKIVSGFLLLLLIVQTIFFNKKLRRIRKDSVKRSRSVLGGQMAEQVAPFLPEFPCNPADVRFIGKPVDFVAFPGMASGKEINEVLLIEVKTGTSTLSGREKEIKRAVERSHVKYVEYRALDS